MKVSITIVTYNQEKTIAQTIESVLHQEGNFDYEIVIGEDCSTDNTWSICKQYADLYPQKIRLLPNTHNLGILANFARTNLACKGEYITGCAGDDYWCDNHKIEKQLDFLENHPDYGVVTTEGYMLYVRTGVIKPGLSPRFTPIDGQIKSFYFSPTYSGGVFVPPLTQMYRATLLNYIDFEEMIRRKFPVEDYPMQAIWSQYTKFGHLQDITCVYRVYKESATFISYDNPHYMDYIRGIMNIRRYLNELFPKDACFSEQEMQEYEFYKEFLLYLHQLDYKKAKFLIANRESKIECSAKLLQAKRFTKTWVHFVSFHFYKRYTEYKEIYKQT